MTMQKSEKALLLASGMTSSVNNSGGGSSSSSSSSPAGDDDAWKEKHNVRGAMRTFLVALGVFALSMGAGRLIASSLIDWSRSSFVENRTSVAATRGSLSSPPPHMRTWDTCGAAELPVLSGADVVAYVSLEEGAAAVFGRERHELVYSGYRFWFVSEENKALFEENPLTYVPAWGGFCSFGISREDRRWTRDTLGPASSPDAWLILEGVLYMFRSPWARDLFVQDVSGSVDRGNALWGEWFGEGALPGADGEGSPLDTECVCSADACEDD